MVEDFVNYGNLKYADLSSLRTSCKPQSRFHLSDLHVNISDLWCALHTGDFTTMPLFNVLFQDRKLIYHGMLLLIRLIVSCTSDRQMICELDIAATLETHLLTNQSTVRRIDFTRL